MDEHRVPHQQRVQRRDGSRENGEGLVSRQPAHRDRHDRDGGDGAREREELKRPLRIGEQGVQPAPDEEQTGADVQRHGDHVPHVDGPDVGGVDEVVVPQRPGIQPRDASHRGASGYRDHRQREGGPKARAPPRSERRNHVDAGADDRPRPCRQRCEQQQRCSPDRGNQPFEPRDLTRQQNVLRARPVREQLVDRKTAGSSAAGLPLEIQRAGAAVLLVFDHDLVSAGRQREIASGGMHVGRGRSPEHQLAVQPDVETVVSRAVKSDRARFRHMPEPMPPCAEKMPRQGRIIVQEVERHVAADVCEDRYAGEADVREYPAVQPRAVG